jgi:hypothetical protein
VLSALLICCVVSPISAADIQTGFEEWWGHNYEPIAGKIAGLSFGTTADTDAFFADINAKVSGGYDWYSLTSDNTKVSGDGEYFISGDIAAYVLDGDMKISMTGSQRAREFTLGISNYFAVTLEAYDETGTLISGPTGVAAGTPNTKTQPVGHPGAGLQFLSVSSGTINIAYVVLRGDPGYYMIDTVSCIVPEPTGILGIAVGLAGLLGMVTRKRRE